MTGRDIVIYPNVDSSLRDLEKAYQAHGKDFAKPLDAAGERWYQGAIANARAREARRGFAQRTIDATRAFLGEWLRKDGAR